MHKMYYPYPPDAVLWWEAEQRELLMSVYLETGDDEFIYIEFITLRRLMQESGDFKGNTAYPINSVVVVPEVNFKTITDAIANIKSGDFIYYSRKFSRGELGELWPLEDCKQHPE